MLFIYTPKMFFILLSVVFYSKSVDCELNSITPIKNVTEKQFIYNTYKYDDKIHLYVNNWTEQIMDFYEDNDDWQGHPTRVHVSSDSTMEYPVFITAAQQKGVSSWELPLAVTTSHSAMIFNDMGRTLCPHDAGPNITSVNRPQLQVTTFSPTNVSVDIKLRRVRDFYIQLDKEVSLVATPSAPKYYYFSFDSSTPENNTNHSLHGFLPRFNYTIPKSVILIIDSDSDLCATVSIQNNSCPVFDNEKDVSYQGYHLTMSNKGGITLTQSMFPVGFYVVFIVKQSDEECVGPDGPLQATFADRTKDFRFRIIATISYKEFVVGAVVTLAVFFLVVLLTLLVLLPSYTSRCTETEVVVVEEEPGPSTSREQEPLAAERSDEESLSDSIREWPEPTEPLTVAGLSKARPKAHARRSDRYFWSALTVAVVYALPVVQLLFTYQQMVFQTGNQDLCYYNFLCAHPLGMLSDFNHVYSNIGYVLLGLVFALQVRARAATPNQPDMGIPEHHGLFYSMGLALAMEGLLSACYHLCPNKMNFQFDSSFMYVIAVLCMVKLYQNRHPDVNASAHATFMLLALLITIGLFGIMYPSVYFWVVFTIMHLASCLMLTLKIYYVGQFKLERGVCGRAVSALRAHRWAALRPRYGARAVLLALANLANWALAAYGLYEHKKDFARHLLAILMGNTILYTIFYIVMKLVHREKVPIYCWLYLAAAHAAWFFAFRLFLDSKTKWSETPAQSRRHNAQCSSLQFYDSHDAWHAASAAALYLSFNALLTVDDPLRRTPRREIPVF